MDNKYIDKFGKVKEVFFENAIETDNLTGNVRISNRSFFLWADKGLSELISKVPGVINVVNISDARTRYQIVIDMRYDIEFIKAEIEAEILCRPE